MGSFDDCYDTVMLSIYMYLCWDCHICDGFSVVVVLYYLGCY